MTECPASGRAAVALPERVTVLTCIGCGGMGRQERCEGDCSEHKLLLVDALEYDALLDVAHTARLTAARLAGAIRPFTVAQPGEPSDVLARLRAVATSALRAAGRTPARTDWSTPATVTGWWCAECGNVDMPQPCIGVCVWRPVEWVNLTLYERQLRLSEPHLRAARSLGAFLARVVAVTPRAGQAQRNLEAFERQARVALEDYAPGAPATEAPPVTARREARDLAVQVHAWPH
ncbi:MAG TPA: hypothetical protein VI300_11470 [Solirubrobacter sp.]